MKCSLPKYLVLAILFFLTTIFSSVYFVRHTHQAKMSSFQKEIVQLEKLSGGRLGVFAINTANNESLQYRAKERFPLCSTSKVMTVAAVLSKSVKDPKLLQKQIIYNPKDIKLARYAPITRRYVANGMNITQLCEAAIRYSDNLAMNLLIENLGGLQAVNSFARSISDNTFRLDRFEPELNTSIPGDIRDTTSPVAMATSLQQLVLANSLALKQREHLSTWLKNNTTGDFRIRSGVPKGWFVGDKTGTGAYGTTNDIGVIWPPKCAPIVLAIYFTQNKKDALPRDDIISKVTQLLITEFARTDKCIKL